MSLRQSPVFVMAFLLVLILPQAVAFVWQWHDGFRPFVRDPQRVSLSWDMFSNRVERCTLKWDYPIQIGQNRLSSLRDVELPFEWDVILDYAYDYHGLARSLCPFSTTAGNSAHFRCYFPDGQVRNDELSCP